MINSFFLFDGLDEVPEEYRLSCLEAINHFQRDYSARMVVCSRIGDYESLQKKLNLSMAIYLEELSQRQINKYLEQFGDRLEGIRNVLKHNNLLQELARSPLMLSLMPIACEGMKAEEIEVGETADEMRDLLLARYVAKVFDRQPLIGKKLEEQAIHWLSFIANGLDRHAKTVFRLEELQHTWLPFEKAKIRYKLMVSLVVGLIVGLMVGLMVGIIDVAIDRRLSEGLTDGIVYGLIAWAIAGAITWVIAGDVRVQDKERFDFDSSLDRHWSGRVKRVLNEGLLFGLLVGLIYGLVDGLVGNLSGGFNTPQLVELIFDLIFGRDIPVNVIDGLINGLINGLKVGLLVGLATGLIGATINEFFEYEQLPDQRITPNQGLFYIKKSGLVYGLILGLSVMLTDWWMFGPSSGLKDGVIIMIVFGVVFGMSGGLINIISHYTIRYLLKQEGLLPYPWSGWLRQERDRELVGYLDGMVKRWLLLRVGNGWVFRHRYLLEYFATRSLVKLNVSVTKSKENRLYRLIARVIPQWLKR